MAAKLIRLTHKIAIKLRRAVPFAVLAPCGQSGNFWLHHRVGLPRCNVLREVDRICYNESMGIFRTRGTNPSLWTRLIYILTRKNELTEYVIREYCSFLILFGMSHFNVMPTHSCVAIRNVKVTQRSGMGMCVVEYDLIRYKLFVIVILREKWVLQVCWFADQPINFYSTRILVLNSPSHNLHTFYYVGFQDN
jgi:hypothetical protein